MAGISRRTFLSLMGLTVTAPPLVGAGGYYYATEYEPDWLEVTHVELTLPRLAPQFNGFRLVQFSDIHRDLWMTPARVADVINQVNAQPADAVVITGDFVTGLIRDVAPDMTQALSLLNKPAYAIPGNWDHWGYIPRWEQLMEESGITNLMNRSASIEREGQVLHIAGLDDALEGTPQLDEVTAQIPPEGAAILLMHEPDFADYTMQKGRFDLQLSGHSHGGQIDIPILGPQYLPEMGQKYIRGLYQANNFQLYVNRGVGMVRYGARFNCRPEITVFTLRSPNL